MRIFWSIILLGALAGAIYVVVPPSEGGGGEAATSTAPRRIEPAPQPPPSQPDPPTPEVSAERSLPAAGGSETDAPTTRPGSEATPRNPQVQDVTSEEMVSAAKSPDGSPGVTPGSETTSVDPESDAAGKIGAFSIAPGKVERKSDGSILLDDRFTISGDGTAEKPYEITWELLVSVEQDFDPQAGKKRVPERIAMLHDKYVRLSGWIAFPLNVQSPRELLLMLNQWDGCCIGVPPTPYDAIEATLDKVAVGDARFAVTGAVTGKFGVKPYIVGDWLVGLYTMENGTFNPKTFSGGGS